MAIAHRDCTPYDLRLWGWHNHDVGLIAGDTGESADAFSVARVMIDSLAACDPDGAVGAIDIKGVAAMLDFAEEFSCGIVFVRSRPTARPCEEVAHLSEGQASGALFDFVKYTLGYGFAPAGAGDPESSGRAIDTQTHRREVEVDCFGYPHAAGRDVQQPIAA